VNELIHCYKIKLNDLQGALRREVYNFWWGWILWNLKLAKYIYVAWNVVES
jgi:hypothetical protein